ncbi:MULTISPECIES: helix-turn-helix domain-containing protein [unclassified Paenibacillus]|uniref:winged helix-turn-helix transcriptional regulator n=1 Tax=Paenibacillus TaxID=44249 RepID=UPI002786C00B|nr:MULTISPECIES: helix-turn-helix domain-containing protein [unclassified Paenibacillus]MDQ0718800.1 DNA-binding HxlR family transcriptional regulator [Paenibacillus sp. W4I10]MDR6718295.1 DNA-binding HxlR family transcriptional regulator [Paenibacillus sp. 2003]
MTVYCKFGTALDILTGKWKSLILLRLLSNGTMRFRDLQKAIPDISKKMLTQQLKELEYHDIVHREVYAQIPPKVEYSITEYGQLMKPVLQTMSDWGAGHMQHMEKLYGKENEKGANPSELRKIDSLR